MKLVLALLALLAVPAASALDLYDDPLRRVQRGAVAHDTLLAALGEATVACLGGVTTADYRVNRDGALERAFDACTTRDTGALERIDRLLGVQYSREGEADRLAARFAFVWNRAVRAFPERFIQQCPTWELLHVIDAPTPERVAFFAAKEGAAGIGKEYKWYKVTSEQCGSNGFCAVLQARLCAAGFSNQFVVWSDPFSSTVILDPVWWLTDYDFEGESNPFTNPSLGYKHPMSFYGDDVPGALYASIEREGETCTRWGEINQKHYTDRKLVAIDCGPLQDCMCICK
jgi:hypothetical protein